MSDEPGDGVCRIAFESALNKAQDMCEDGEMGEAMKPFFGIQRDSDLDCTQVLVTGINPNSSMTDVRQWVHCRTNKLVEEEGMDVNAAISQAWDEAEEETDDGSDLPPYDELFGDDDGEDEYDDVDLGLTDPDLELEDSPIPEE